MPSDPSVYEHLKQCPPCAELFRDDAVLGRRLASALALSSRFPVSQLSETDAMLESEHGVRAFLRSRSTHVRWALSLALPALLLARELLQGRVEWRTFSAPKALAGVALLALLGVVAHGALRPMPLGLLAARLRNNLALVAWCVPCVLWFAPEARASTESFSSGFALRSFACFSYASALAAPSFALLWALERGVQLPFRVWALAAGAVAILANLILLLHCPSNDRAHLLLGHFSIGLVWFAAVSFAGWRAQRAH